MFGEQELLAIEAVSTGPCAQLSAWASRRYPMETEGRRHELRTAFQHDRDRIVHSRAFRRLKHKTQVFIPYTNDHQRTRLTHTIEVMQISRTIARCLGLNEDLTEAVALGHDLGHTPFGHVGEKVLHGIMTGAELLEGLPVKVAEQAGGFRHNLQSLKIADEIEARYRHPGINLTDQAREGILKHTSWADWIEYPGLVADGLNLDREFPNFEGQVVSLADEITQHCHDLEDGLRGGIIPLHGTMQLRLIKLIASRNEVLQDKRVSDFVKQNTIIRSLIHVLVSDVIQESAKRLDGWCSEHGVRNHEDFLQKQGKISRCIHLGSKIAPLFRELEQYVIENVIRSRPVRLNDESGKYLISELFRIYYEDPLLLPDYVLARYKDLKKIDHLRFLARRCSEEEVRKEAAANYHGNVEFVRLIGDYIAGMSNTYAIREYEKWIMPFHG